jgi:hypothetical protein
MVSHQRNRKKDHKTCRHASQQDFDIHTSAPIDDSGTILDREAFSGKEKWDSADPLLSQAPLSKIHQEEFSVNPSPEGRRWPEGPDEGYRNFRSVPLTRRPSLDGHPLPSREGRSITGLEH